MKKLFLIFALFAGITASQAATTVLLAQAASTNAALISQPIVLQSLTMWNNSATPVVVNLYDGASFRTNAAWTNYTVAATNVITTYTNTQGIVNSLTNTVYKTFTSEHAAGAVTNTPTITLVVPASSVPATFEINPDVSFGRILSADFTGTNNFVLTWRNP